MLLFLIYYFFSFCNFIFAGPHWKPHVCEVGSLLKDLYDYYYFDLTLAIEATDYQYWSNKHLHKHFS